MYIWEPCLVVFRHYSWICAQGTHLTVRFGNHMRWQVLNKVKPKARKAPSTLLCLQP